MPSRFRRGIRLALFSVVGAAGCLSGQPVRIPELPPARNVGEFETHLEQLRVALGIPAFSAAIAKGKGVVWAKGFGLSDIANNTKATAVTQYHLASLTKPFAATVVLQLVQAGKVSLDDPVSKYHISLPNSPAIRVRHLMSHTSEGTPGARYRYSGDRFGLLDSVIFYATGQRFSRLLADSILGPLGLRSTAPNPQARADFDVTGFDRASYVARMAAGYGVVRDSIERLRYPAYFGTAAGLISTAPDVAKFSIALDTGAFLRAATRDMAFAPAVSLSGDTLPYGLGWFSTRAGMPAERVVWHYGYWTGNSSLIIKVPARGLTFVILANSDMLSRPTRLGSGDLMSSSVARAFINSFVTGSASLP